MAAARAAGQELLTVSGSYDLDHLDYTFTNPDRVFRVTHFFVDHWLPLLGPSLAWMVVAMQQACWRQGTRHPDGQISQRRLGQLCGLKRETVNRHLNNPSNLIQHFITDVNAVHNANGSRTSNRYHVMLNDPLPPQLILGLQQHFLQDYERLLPTQSPEQAAAKSLSTLLNLDREALITILSQYPTEKKISLQPVTIRSLVTDIFGLHQSSGQKVNAIQTTQLSRRLLQPDKVYISTQYFRQHWVPMLGATPAWLITVLRRYCYENKETGELRDTFTFDKKVIAAKLGISTKTLQRCLAKFDHLQAFFPEFEITHHTIRGRILVNTEPLTPEDRHKKEQLEDRLIPSQPALTSDPEIRETFSLTSTSNKPNEPKGQNITSGQTQSGQIITPDFHAKKTKYHRGNDRSRHNITSPDQRTGQNITGHQHSTGQNVTDSKHESSNTFKNSTLKQQQTADDATTLNKLILSKLDELNIRPPTRDELLNLPHIQNVNYLSTWLNWYQGQDVFGPGWIIQQLRAGLHPPETPDIDFSLLNLPVGVSSAGSLTSHELLWQEVLSRLQGQTTKQIFETWLKDTQARELSEEALTVQVKTSQAREWLTFRFKPTVERVVQQILGREVRVQFEVM